MSLALLLLAGAVGGAAVGAVAGLVPGFHPNTLAVLALGALPVLGGEAALAVAAGLVALGLAHQFTALVPGGFLGAPSADDALRALPAHELLREGRAHEAVQLAAQGTAVGAAVALALVPVLRLILGSGGAHYEYLAPSIPLVLVGLGAVLLGSEHAEVPWRRAVVARPFRTSEDTRVEGVVTSRRGLLVRLDRTWVHDPLGLLETAEPGTRVTVWGPRRRVPDRGSRLVGVLGAVVVFAIAGLLGAVVMGLPTPSPLGLPSSPMFPLLTGLFGAPPLLLALHSPPPPPQQERPVAEPRRDLLRGGAAGAACGTLVGLLPGLSSGAASVVAMLAVPARRREHALITLSAAGAGAAVTTAAAFVLLGKARSGAMLAVAEIVPPEPWAEVVPPQLLAVLLLGCAVGAAVGYPAALLAGRGAARVVDRVPYARLCGGVLALLLVLVVATTGLTGLAVLAVAAGVGMLPWRWGLRKSHLMGCTMLPIIAGGLAG